VKLLEKVKDSELFERWFSIDASGNHSSPFQLLVLGALRYLGRGLTFDDIEECTAISEETHRKFFHVFITFGSTVLYNEFIKMPSFNHEIAENVRDFAEASLNGGIASVDATNVLLIYISYHSNRWQ